MVLAAILSVWQGEIKTGRESPCDGHPGSFDARGAGRWPGPHFCLMRGENTDNMGPLTWPGALHVPGLRGEGDSDARVRAGDPDSMADRTEYLKNRSLRTIRSQLWPNANI